MASRARDLYLVLQLLARRSRRRQVWVEGIKFLNLFVQMILMRRRETPYSHPPCGRASLNNHPQSWSGSVARVLLPQQERRSSMPGLGWAARNLAEALCSPKADPAREE